jgi:flagellar L-ring protein precursor FlgH
MNRNARTLAICIAALGVAASSAESLYKEETFRPLVSDNKARRVGDTLSVLVLENSSAASTADTSANRKNGLGFEYLDPLRRNRAIQVQTNNDFDGRGVTQRAGRLLAQIAVTVQAIEPNGDLRIAGEQLLEINHEQQKIKLEGRVRAQDITDQNTVISTRVADARISYVGEGDLAARQRPAWWHTVLTWFGL